MSDSLSKFVNVGGRRFKRFWPLNRAVTDDSVRCIFCGQIDEPDVHEMTACHGLRIVTFEKAPA